VLGQTIGRQYRAESRGIPPLRTCRRGHWRRVISSVPQSNKQGGNEFLAANRRQWQNAAAGGRREIQNQVVCDGGITARTNRLRHGDNGQRGRRFRKTSRLHHLRNHGPPMAENIAAMGRLLTTAPQ